MSGILRSQTDQTHLLGRANLPMRGLVHPEGSVWSVCASPETINKTIKLTKENDQ